MSQTALLSSARASAFWGLVIPGALILAITMGARQSMGLFVSPLNTTTGLGLANISFALAIGQFVWGATQPLFGIVADRHGPGRVIVAGALIATLGVLSAAGAGAGSFSILIGSAAQRISAEKRSVAAGIINAGGSLGQFIFAPLAQFLIVALSWQKAMLVFAASALLTIPLAWPLRRQKTSATLSSTTGVAAAQTTDLNLRGALKQAFADKSYLCLHAGFFTCGFHIAFLVTHLPQEVALCNLSPSVSAYRKYCRQPVNRCLGQPLPHEVFTFLAVFSTRGHGGGVPTFRQDRPDLLHFCYCIGPNVACHSAPDRRLSRKTLWR
jgi:MFS family permease